MEGYLIFTTIVRILTMALRVIVRKDQSRRFQGSVDLVDFHIYNTVFHAGSRGAIRFSKFNYCSGLR